MCTSFLPGRGKQVDFPRRRRRLGQRARVRQRLDREAFGTTPRDAGARRQAVGTTPRARPLGQPRGPLAARRGA
eukprot:8659-Pyramimonas_sp.AAC.1